MQNFLKVEYARALIAGIPSVQRFNCDGCQFKSQDHHCIMLYTEEKIQLWFESLLAFIDEGHVIQEISVICGTLECIEQTVLQEFISKLSDDDWRIQMKTDIWKADLLQTAIRLSRLESRFH